MCIAEGTTTVQIYNQMSLRIGKIIDAMTILEKKVAEGFPNAFLKQFLRSNVIVLNSASVEIVNNS